MSHPERMAFLSSVYSAYGEESFVEDVSALFPAPPPRLELQLRRVRAGVWEASWPSVFEPYLPEVADRYLSRIENRTARARLFLANEAFAPTSRPAVVAVHGYMGGQWLVEENAWPIEWLLRRGLDVALPVLPLHASRNGARRGAPGFPSSDLRVTNEGFRQAVADIRTLVRWLRERGAPHVGVMGMSLGGYTSALVATVTTEIDFVMPMIPLASLADFAREQGRLGSGVQMEELYDGLERAHRVVSPLARPLALSKTRALVVGAEFDRVTPATHASRLSRHFDCEMVTIAGGHLVQFGRSSAFRALGELLEREGIVEPRRARA